ncbi:MAG: hypothetical protein Kow00108_09270 [Calditrichia bacterium]
MYRRINFFILLIFIFVSFSCVKYSFKGSLPSYLETIYITLFNDVSGYPQAPEDLTNEVTNNFIQDNTLRVISDKKNADLILSGTIQQIQVNYETIGGDQSAGNRRLTLVVKVECLDTHQNKPLWSKSISKSTPYESDLEQTLQEAIRLVAEEIVNLTIAAW